MLRNAVAAGAVKHLSVNANYEDRAVNATSYHVSPFITQRYILLKSSQQEVISRCLIKAVRKLIKVLISLIYNLMLPVKPQISKFQAYKILPSGL
jgi:hypothetical protein